ncbi:MAG: hypothetical protein RIQ78_412, partial [Bacteroidota bacterium]
SYVCNKLDFFKIFYDPLSFPIFSALILHPQIIKITLITVYYEKPPSEHVIVLFTPRFL